MKNIVIIILSLLIFAKLEAQPQPIKAGSLSFPKVSNTTVIKISPSILNGDSLRNDVLVTGKAVNDFVRSLNGGIDFSSFISDTVKSITTTDATPTNMDTIRVPTNTILLLGVTIVYHNSSVKGDNGVITGTIQLTNVTGFITAKSNLSSTGNGNGTVSGASLTVVQLSSTGPASIECTGVTSTNIVWTIQRTILTTHLLN